MPVHRRPKMALFGWLKNNRVKTSAQYGQIQWLEKTLKEADIPLIDWFRQAQDRKKWLKAVNKAYPRTHINRDQEKALNKWRAGTPLPGVRQEEEASGSQGQPTQRQEVQQDPSKPYECPVCQETFAKGNQLQFHHEEHHSVCNPRLVTSQMFTCEDCKQGWRRIAQLKFHDCPAKKPPVRYSKINTDTPPAAIKP